MPINQTWRSTLIAASTVLLLSGCSQKSPEEAIIDAQAAFEAKQYDTAIVELKSAIQDAPRNAQARFLLGQIYLEQEQFASAEKELERAREFGYPIAEVIPLLSRAYQRNGTLAGLQKLDTAGVNLGSMQEVQVGFYRAQSLLQLDKQAEARELLVTLSQLEVDSAFKELVDVLIAMQAEDVDAAKTKLINIVEEYPTQTDALMMLTKIYLSENNKENAAATLGRYLAETKSDLESEFMYAQLLLEVNRPAEAEPYITKLIDIAPKNARLHQLHSMIMAAQEKFAEAQASAMTALKLGTDNTIIRFVAGFSAFQQQDYAEAMAQLGLIADELPDNHPGLKMLAASQLEMGQTFEASRVLSRYTDTDAGDAGLFAIAGFELLQDGMVNEARDIVGNIAPSDDPMDMARLGALKVKLNDLDGILDLENAVQADPNSNVAKQTLATAYIATEKYAEALTLASRWQEEEPENYKAFLLAGEAHLRLQQYDLGEQALRKANQLAPENAQTHLALVNVFMQREEHAEAFAQVESTLEKFPNNANAIASYYALVKLLQRDDKDPLAPLAKALTAEDADNVLLLLGAQLYSSERDFDSASQIITRISNTDSIPREYWSIKSQILYQKQNVAGLEQHFDEWLDAFPNDRRAFIGRAVMYELKREYRKGIEFIEKHPNLANTVPATALLSKFYVRLRDHKRARTLFNQLPLATQDNVSLQSVLARLFLLEGNHEAALAPAKAAFAHQQSRDNLLVLHDALRINGFTDDAKTLLLDYEKEQPNDPAAKILLAQEFINKAPQQAVKRYREIIAIQPDNFVALNNLAHLMKLEGNYEEALALGERALKIAPTHPAVIDTIAQIYSAQGFHVMALEQYTKLDVDSIENEEIMLNFVEALLLNDRAAIARRHLNDFEFTDVISQDRIKVLKSKYNI